MCETVGGSEGFVKRWYKNALHLNRKRKVEKTSLSLSYLYLFPFFWRVFYTIHEIDDVFLSRLRPNRLNFLYMFYFYYIITFRFVLSIDLALSSYLSRYRGDIASTHACLVSTFSNTRARNKWSANHCQNSNVLLFSILQIESKYKIASSSINNLYRKNTKG